jgi:hypothetical protein
MTRTATLTALLALCTGCTGSESETWLLFLSAFSDQTTDYTCEENFRNGNCPADSTPVDSEWTYENTVERDTDRFFAELINGPSNNAYLVVGGEIFVGSRDGKVYTFTSDNFSDTEDKSTHDSGYSYTEQYFSEGTTTVSLTMGKGDTLTGTLSGSQTTEQTWLETDTWVEDDVGYYYGQIPASGYLEGTDPNNYPTESDCESSPCMLRLKSTGNASAPLQGVRTKADEEVYPGIDGAGDIPF